jgi:hypothetical protein
MFKRKANKEKKKKKKKKDHMFIDKKAHVIAGEKRNRGK